MEPNITRVTSLIYFLFLEHLATNVFCAMQPLPLSCFFYLVNFLNMFSHDFSFQVPRGKIRAKNDPSNALLSVNAFGTKPTCLGRRPSPRPGLEAGPDPGSGSVPTRCVATCRAAAKFPLSCSERLGPENDEMCFAWTMAYLEIRSQSYIRPFHLLRTL
jgi:hypothetical protein